MATGPDFRLPANVANEKHQKQGKVASWIIQDQRCWNEDAVHMTSDPSNTEEVFKMSISA